MEPEDRAREIRQRMAALRRELSIDARSVGRSARAMADWRFYVERFPFAAAAAAAAIGFMIVPRRSQVIVPDADALADLAKQNRVWVKTGSPKSQDPARGMLGGLLAIAASAATKAAVNWATHHFQSTLAARQPAQEPADETMTPKRSYPPR